MISTRPDLSVIIPVHQGGGILRACLDALQASDLPRARWELIIVDDASTDQTATIAASSADVIVSLTGSPRGPGYARNRGAEVAGGEYLLFISADVRVFPDTLGRLVFTLANNPSVGAVCATYDPDTSLPGFVNQYRYLHRAFGNGTEVGDVSGFLGGCGAVRTSVFLQAGMHNEWWVNRPRVEAADMGQRIRWLGHRIIHDPAIRATHIKRWTLGSLLSEELRDSGIPWGEEPTVTHPHTTDRLRRLRRKEHYGTEVLWLAIVLAVSAAIPVELKRQSLLLVASGFCVLTFLGFNRLMYYYFARRRGVLFALATVPMHLLSSLAAGWARFYVWARRHTLGEPRPDPTIEAMAEVGVGIWPPVPARRRVFPSSAGIAS